MGGQENRIIMPKGDRREPDKTMLPVIKNLKTILEKCASGQSLSLEEAAWLACALQAYFERRCRTLDEAFGLFWPKGGVPWWLADAIGMRNRTLVELADRFYADLPTSARAKQIAQIALRYAAANWPIDREKPEMPEYYSDSPRQYLWLAFKSGAAMPLCERQLRNILGR
jgi:hypothetical protein